MPITKDVVMFIPEEENGVCVLIPVIIGPGANTLKLRGMAALSVEDAFNMAEGYSLHQELMEEGGFSAAHTRLLAEKESEKEGQETKEQSV